MEYDQKNSFINFAPSLLPWYEISANRCGFKPETESNMSVFISCNLILAIIVEVHLHKKMGLLELWCGVFFSNILLAFSYVGGP
jgi:hypothetical protein